MLTAPKSTFGQVALGRGGGGGGGKKRGSNLRFSKFRAREPGTAENAAEHWGVLGVLPPIFSARIQAEACWLCHYSCSSDVRSRGAEALRESQPD